MLQIEIQDSDCEEDEVYTWVVPIDTDKKDIMTAISVFYPEVTSIHIFVISSN